MAKTESIPLYKQVSNDLKALIDSGEFKKGDLLPSENELSKRYDTTRVTIRQALSGLMNMGYITRRHGKGSIVSEPKQGLGILSLSGVTASIGNKDLETVILQKPTKQSWPVDFFYDLDENERKQGCVFFTRLRYIHKVPVLYEETFITDVNLPKFTSRNLENRSLFEVLSKHYQIAIKGGEQKIWAIRGDKRISELLNTKVNQPAVHMKRRLSTNVKGLYIYSFIYCNTEEYYLQDDF